MKMIVYIVEILYDLWQRIQYKTHFSTKLSENGGMKINDDNDGAFRGGMELKWWHDAITDLSIMLDESVSRTKISQSNWANPPLVRPTTLSPILPQFIIELQLF